MNTGTQTTRSVCKGGDPDGNLLVQKQFSNQSTGGGIRHLTYAAAGRYACVARVFLPIHQNAAARPPCCLVKTHQYHAGHERNLCARADVSAPGFYVKQRIVAPHRKTYSPSQNEQEAQREGENTRMSVPAFASF